MSSYYTEVDGQRVRVTVCDPQPTPKSKWNKFQSYGEQIKRFGIPEHLEGTPFKGMSYQRKIA